MAVTITYEYPVPGAAPTAAEVRRFSTVIASVEATAAGDLLATIIHNMALSVAELAAGWPIVITEMLLAGGWVKAPHQLAAGRLTNSLAITMENAGGVGGDMFRVTILRPNTIVR